MKLECYVLSAGDIDIRPASNRREWMDATPDRYAYRCLPLSIANAHGWVICCGGGFRVEWNGGSDPRDVQVSLAGDGEVKVEGHFGSGIVTISIPAMFRTEADYNLWVSGPPNSFKDGIHPLSAVVETDWMPYSFTMNWKITRPNHPIGFEKGEPFCFLFPVKRGLVEQVEPALRDLDEDAESKRQFKYAGRLRKFLSDVKQIKKDATPDPKPSEPSGSSAGTCRGPCLTVPAPSRAIRRAWRSSRSRTCGIARPERSPKGSSLHPVVDLPYLQPLLRAHHYVSA